MSLDEALRAYYAHLPDDPQAERRLRDELRTPLPPHPGMPTPRRTRTRTRTRPATAAAVGAVVLTGLIVYLINGSAGTQNPATGRSSAPVSRSSSPSTVPSTRPPTNNPGIAAGFVPEKLIAASPNGLVLQAPSGRIRWTLQATCSVEMKRLPPAQAGGGGLSGSCPFAPHLSIGAQGNLGGSGVLFSIIGGRVSPATGLQVTVTLANGHTATYTPRHSYWLAIIQRCGDYPGTEIRTVTATANNGHVIARHAFAERTPPPGLDPEQACNLGK